MKQRKIDWRLYTALYYLNKGIIEAFYDLLLSKYNSEFQLYDNEDIICLNKAGYINFKSWNNIFITKKGLELLNTYKSTETKEEIKSKIEITNEIVNDFISGFPSNRYGKLNELKEKLIKFINNHPSYTLETIIKAKNEYIKNEKKQNYTYTMNATNFIVRELDNYCRFIILTKDEINSFDGIIME